jgi:N-acetylglucosaminyldiphosphoundecaprenol N-acetyl-beta-D-mannosaminyltransferase
VDRLYLEITVHMLKSYNLYQHSLEALPTEKLLITTLNAHSYNVARKDAAFSEALLNSDVLIPDGVSVVGAIKLLTGQRLKKIAGEDLFYYEMKRLESRAKNQDSKQGKREKAFFLGSSESVLQKIKVRAAVEFPTVEIHTYSPPYKPEFNTEENAVMIAIINTVQPDVLFVGMTAPKQEKWAYEIMNNGQLTIDNCHVCCIGAVFDFYAGTVNRAPQWLIKIHLEWFYRLVKEPRRMWRRYLVGNVRFVWAVAREAVNS